MCKKITDHAELARIRQRQSKEEAALKIKSDLYSALYNAVKAGMTDEVITYYVEITLEEIRDSEHRRAKSKKGVCPFA